MVKIRFGTGELGKDEIGTDGLVYLRFVKLSYASYWCLLHTKPFLRENRILSEENTTKIFKT